MAPKIKPDLRPVLAIDIEESVYMNDHTYIPKAPMKDGRRNIWYGNAPIPYSIAGNIYAFMGPLLRRIKKSQIHERFLSEPLNLRAFGVH